ncbi:hypothetical protein KC19_2G269100 [Ceratodon purpureus]|uniref:Uncharacterized protein n=1 Tax=Ceratodon purpureus TaxID=3225 RepID=A0A8T0IYI3_CERPU|nr:hypothetical protein KC19_2G269100 [Ceratodon purpureus]
MGTSVMKSSRLVVMILAVVLLETCASEVDAALRVYNGIEAETITVRQPPGCCNYCTGEVCPTVCQVCKDVVIKSRTEVTLEPNVGPYPLESLIIRVQGDIYCVPEGDRKYLTASAQLRIGPGDCGQAFPYDIRSNIVDGSNRIATCLRLCGQS